MSKTRQVVEGIFFTLCLLGISFLLLNDAELSARYGFPNYFLPALSFVIILYIGYRFILIYNNLNDLEHEFTSIVNHVFRTPITSISWYAKELEKELPREEKLLYLQNIENSTGKILSIVDLFAGVKSIRDKSGYFFEAISIREIVEKSLAKYREEINKKNLNFKVSTFSDIPLLTIDLKKIGFVVDTLIENAILYTPKDGKVLVECIAGPKKLTLYVSDTGIGLGFFERMRLFTRFYRGKRARLANPDGMGLRLYLSREIMARHKGKIYAKSKGEDRGATFFLELPYSSHK
ncbi:MAG TPA: HAMP domain-containing sensor histidine kinase [Candidatus Paceibacterota bacterium]|nr:HAMP domain-containing sensor histidine kinase [Candidatus Paceibacterota bacterium]